MGKVLPLTSAVLPQISAINTWMNALLSNTSSEICVKWNLRHFGSFKIFSLREGCTFQTQETEPTCESGGSSWWGCSCRTSLVSWRKQERRLRHHQFHMYSCNPTEQLPGAEHGRPQGVHREPSGHQHKWTPLLGVKHDLTLLAGSQNQGPGGLRALGLLPPRPTYTHLAPPHGHWVSFLLPPTLRGTHSLSPWKQPLLTSLHFPQAFIICGLWAYHPLSRTFWWEIFLLGWTAG